METTLDDWVRLLRGYTRADITRAFDAYGETGTRARPLPYDIAGRCAAWTARQKRLAELAERVPERRALPGPARDETPVTPERYRQILDEAGMTPERIAAVKRFPMARSFADAERKAAAARSTRLRPEEYMTEAEMREEGLL